MSNPAAFARRDKDAHPDRYCRVPSCLWITARNPCRNHPVATTLSACTDCEIVAPDVKLSRDGQSRCAGCELIEHATCPRCDGRAWRYFHSRAIPGHAEEATWCKDKGSCREPGTYIECARCEGSGWDRCIHCDRTVDLNGDCAPCAAKLKARG